MKIETTQIQKNVSIIKINDNQYILKMLLQCFDNDWGNKKNKYLQFLIKNGVHTPYTSTCILKDGIYEMQDFVCGESLKNLDNDIFKSLAIFHNISKRYRGGFNKKYYNVDIDIKNVKLDKLLLGFREKFYTYPIQSLQKLNLSKETKKIIINLIKDLYRRFICKYGICDCIIHNDLTSNNYLKLIDGQYAFIDFDLSILSSVYVDIGDLIFTKNYRIEEYDLVFSKNKETIESYLKTYNAWGEKKVDFYGLINYAALKLLSYYFYIQCKIKQINKNEFQTVVHFATKVKEVLNEN